MIHTRTPELELPPFPQESPLGREHAPRVPIPKSALKSAEGVYSFMIETSIDIRPYATHPNDFNVSEIGLVMGSDRVWYLACGTNWNPESGSDHRRTCGQSCMCRGSLFKGDFYAGASMINSPQTYHKPIVGCRPQLTLGVCRPCRPIIEMLNPDTVIAGMIEDSGHVEEAYTIGACRNYHDHENGPYLMNPNGTTLVDNLPPSVEFIKAIRKGMAKVEADQIAPIDFEPFSVGVVGIDPADRTQGSYSEDETRHLLLRRAG